MMKWLIMEASLVSNEYRRTAGAKARDDIETILQEKGYKPLMVCAPERGESAGLVKKITLHKKIAKCWDEALSVVKEKDTLFIQFPAVNHTLYIGNVIKKLRARKVKVVALIHDLEVLRLARSTDVGMLQRWRLKKEEVSSLKYFSKIIVHNQHMLRYMNERFSIPKENMIDLEIFDYLVTSQPIESETGDATESYARSVIVAGNLARTKAGYVYSLPEKQQYELYGPNYDGEDSSNIRYHGSFPPEQLPFALKGDFGLVWDGPSAQTCEGAWGGYLQYNNPHKTSLYLASGFPVIIWEKAALADFVKNNHCGITVASLDEIPMAIGAIEITEYEDLKKSAQSVSQKLKAGYYTRKALDLLD